MDRVSLDGVSLNGVSLDGVAKVFDWSGIYLIIFAYCSKLDFVNL